MYMIELLCPPNLQHSCNNLVIILLKYFTMYLQTQHNTLPSNITPPHTPPVTTTITGR